MKEKFKVFYESSEEELSEIWSHSETIFIFDTNILLNLYQYSQETQNEFFKILNIVEARIWIPFHVALEYQRRRLGVIRDEKALFRKINDKLANIEKSMGNNFSEFKLKARNPELFNVEEKFKADVCSLIDKFRVEVNKVGNPQPCVRTYDEIRAKLDGLLEGKVGDEPEKDWILQILEEGVTRYENEVPPGYKDVSKGNDSSSASFTYNNIEYERKFGDLIIWKQILEHLKNSDNIKNVIFVTDDSKEDWWEIVDSGGNKNIGARPELKSEMYRETEVESFKMYHTNDFLTAAKQYCDITIDDKAIEETKNVFYSFKIDNSENLAKWKGILDTVEDYRANNENLAKWKGILDTVEDYRANNENLAKWKGILDTVEDYRANNENLANWKEIFDTMEKYSKDANQAVIINEMMNNINNIDDLDDDQL